MTRAERLVVIGSSGHAKVVIDVAEASGHRIVGLLDRFRKRGDDTLGYPILGAEEDLPFLVAGLGVTACAVAVGDNFVRASIAEKVRSVLPDLPFATLVHPAATLSSHASLGEGTVVMAGAIINSASRIGRLCIVNTAASLDHDSVMEDHSSLAPGAHTGGGVRVCAFSAIGIGAVLIQGVRIGEHSVVGAGAVVLQPLEPYRVAYGVPARVIRERLPGDSYL